MNINHLEKIFKAFGNRRRLAIVHYLKTQPEATVASIAHKIKLSFRSTSKHLLKLSACDILEKEQRNTEVYYRLSRTPPPEIEHVLSDI